MNATSFKVARESRIPPVISGVVVVSSSGFSPGRNSLRMYAFRASFICSTGSNSTAPFRYDSIVCGHFVVSFLRQEDFIPPFIQQRIQSLGDQLVALFIGMIVPFGEPDRSHIVTLKYVAQIQNREACLRSDPQYICRFSLPCSAFDLG